MVGSPNPALDQIRHVFGRVCCGILQRVSINCTWMWIPAFSFGAGDGDWAWVGGTPPLPPLDGITGVKQLIMKRLSGKVLVHLRVKMARNCSIQEAYG